VVVAFDELLAGKFPFAAGRAIGEARLADVEKFFQPATGILWQYFTEALQADIERTGSIFRAKEGVGKVQGRFSKVLVARAGLVEPVVCERTGKLSVLSRSAFALRPVFEDRPRHREQEGCGFNAVERWDEILWPCRRALVRLYVKSDEVESLGPREDGDWLSFTSWPRRKPHPERRRALALVRARARPGEGADRFQTRYAARPICTLRAPRSITTGCRVSQVTAAVPAAVGIYGKIPAERDFVRVNAGAFLRAGLDSWFQEGIEHLQRSAPAAGRAGVLRALPSRGAQPFVGSCSGEDALGRASGGHFFATGFSGVREGFPRLPSRLASFCEASARLATAAHALATAQLRPRSMVWRSVYGRMYRRWSRTRCWSGRTPPSFGLRWESYPRRPPTPSARCRGVFSGKSTAVARSRPGS